MESPGFICLYVADFVGPDEDSLAVFWRVFVHVVFQHLEKQNVVRGRGVDPGPVAAQCDGLEFAGS